MQLELIEKGFMNRLLLDLIRFLLHLPTPKYRLPWLCCVPETNRKVSAFPRTFSAVGLAIVEVRISNVGWSKCNVHSYLEYVMVSKVVEFYVPHLMISR